MVLENGAEIIELAESEVERLIEVAHCQGLTYWQILDIFLRTACDLHIQASAEYFAKGGQ